jgi:hypothetical protein
LIFWLIYEPVAYGDTNAYLRLARPIAQFSLRGYNASRVPGYPAFLALMGGDPGAVWIGQMAIGLMISLLLFWITVRTTGDPVIGFVIGGLYNLLLGQFLFEPNLLSETLTAFFIILSMALFVALWYSERTEWKFAMALLLGIAASGAGMVRPLFFPLTLWYLPFVLLSWRVTWNRRLALAAVYCLGPILIQGGWLLFVKDHYGVFSPTTMSGYSLVQHTGEYFEYLPDEAASIRDIYIRYRDAQIEAKGVHTNAIWEAIPELSKATGLSFFALSREMQRWSIVLIREHPDLYLRSALQGWIDFWKAPIYWDSSVIESAFLAGILAGMAQLGRYFLIAINFLFLLISVLFVMSEKARERSGFDTVLLVTMGMVWLFSVIQTLVDHGDNPRFLVPLQMLVVYSVARLLLRWRNPLPSLEVS